MLRTVLPALAHAVVMNSRPTVYEEGTAENLKAALQVYFGIICFIFTMTNLCYFTLLSIFVMVDIIFFHNGYFLYGILCVEV